MESHNEPYRPMADRVEILDEGRVLESADLYDLRMRTVRVVASGRVGYMGSVYFDNGHTFSGNTDVFDTYEEALAKGKELLQKKQETLKALLEINWDDEEDLDNGEDS